MKNFSHFFLYVSLASLALCISSAIATPQPAASLQTASAELAASLVLDKLAADILAKPSDGAEVFAAMLADPGKFKDPKVAETELIETYRGEISAKYRSESEKLLQHLAGDKPVKEFFSEKFLEGAFTPPAATLDESVKKDYSRIFSSARRRACASQAEKLKSGICPTEAEIEKYSREELTKMMTERIAGIQDTPVFSENLKLISDSIVAPMLADAYNQRDAQLTFVRVASVPGTAPSVIASNIISRLRENIEERRKEKKQGAAVYDFFPSVTNTAVGESVKRRIADQFAAAVNAVDLPLDTTALENAISDNPSKHRRLADSQKAFAPELYDKVTADSITKLISTAPEREHDEIRMYAWEHRTSPDFVKPAKTRVDRDLGAVLADLRAKFAIAQLEKHFPDIAASRWYPSPEFVDTVCEKADYRRTVASWRVLDALKPIADTEAANPLLEETSALLDKNVVTAFDVASVMRGSQRKITEDLFATVKNEALGMAEHPDLNAIIALYSSKVRDSWTEKRKEIATARLGEKDDGRYAALFPSVNSLIELLSKSIFDAINKEEPKPEEPKPPEDTPPEELEAIDLNCEFVFTRSGGNIEVTVMVDGNRAGSFRCSHSPDAYRKEMNSLVSSAYKVLLDAVREKAKTNRVSLNVQMTVNDPLVYYSAVSGVSRGLTAGVEEFGEHVTGVEISEKK